jgi:hypothetical protein
MSLLKSLLSFSKPLALSSWTVIAVLSGCDGFPAGNEGEGEEEGGEGEGEDPREALPAELVAAIRAATSTCAHAYGDGFYDAVDSAEAERKAQETADNELIELQLAANDPLVVIDAAAVAACVADLAEPACDDQVGAPLPRDLRYPIPPFPYEDVCTRVLRGLLGDGDACERDDQCASHVCSVEDCACAGDERVALVDVDGFPCFSEFDCPVGQACAFDDEGSACVDACSGNDDCTEGQACLSGNCVDLAGEDGPCFEDFECGPGLRCFDNTCHATAFADGEPCDFECGDDALFCDSDGGDGICRPRAGDGDPCGAVQCVLGLECGEGGVCGPAPGDGEPCETFNCAVGLACFFTEDNVGTCGPLRGDGEECVVDGQCTSGRCDFFAAVCVAEPGADGEPCDPTTLDPCVPGLVCAAEQAGDVCRSRVSGRAVGDACTPGPLVDNPCPAGLICGGEGTCVGFTVVAEGACDPNGVGNLAGLTFCEGAFSTRVCSPDDQTFTTGTCVDRLGAGEACSPSNDACATGNECLPIQDVCFPLRAEGETCSSALPSCEPGLACEAGTCVKIEDLADKPSFSCSE